MAKWELSLVPGTCWKVEGRKWQISESNHGDWGPEGKTENCIRSVPKYSWGVYPKMGYQSQRVGNKYQLRYTDKGNLGKMRVKSIMWEQVKEEVVWTNPQGRGSQCHSTNLPPSLGLSAWVPLNKAFLLHKIVSSLRVAFLTVLSFVFGLVWFSVSLEPSTAPDTSGPYNVCWIINKGMNGESYLIMLDTG